MTEEEKIKRSHFKRNVIAIPYIIFGFIVALLFIFSPDIIWLVTIFGIFMVYNVIAMFIAFLFKYGRIIFVDDDLIDGWCICALSLYAT